jgi:hypothetical protein
VKKGDGPIFGEPSGIVVDPKSGDVFVTTGNSEESNVLLYGPFLKEAPPKSSAAEGDGDSASSLAPAPGQSAGPSATASLAPTMSLQAKRGTGHRRRACRRMRKRAIAKRSKRSCATKAGAR